MKPHARSRLPPPPRSQDDQRGASTPRGASASEDGGDGKGVRSPAIQGLVTGRL